MLTCMNRDLNKKIRMAYLSEKAKIRQMHEECRMQEANQSIEAIHARRAYVKANRDTSEAKSTQADIDTTSESERSENRAAKGLKVLNEMDIDLEDIIKHVYNKLKSESEASQSAASIECSTPVAVKE